MSIFEWVGERERDSEETVYLRLALAGRMEYRTEKPNKKSRPHTKSHHRDKSRTRLQKRAPKSLHLDIVGSANPFQPSTAAASSSSSHQVIPFLSPLILTAPTPLPTATTTQEGIQRQSNEKKAVTPPPPSGGGGWQHPAVMVASPEPYSLYNVFQSQCVLSSSSL